MKQSRALHSTNHTTHSHYSLQNSPYKKHYLMYTLRQSMTHMKQRDWTCLQPFAVCCFPFDGRQTLQESQLSRGVHVPKGLQALPGQTTRQTPRQRPTVAASQPARITCTQDSRITTADATSINQSINQSTNQPTDQSICMHSNLIPLQLSLCQSNAPDKPSMVLL